MPVIACPHCGTKLNGPDSVLGKEVVCGQCRQRFVAAEVQPFGSQHAQPSQTQEPQDSGLDSMESLTPDPAPPQTPEPESAPQPQTPHESPQPAQWQEPKLPEPPAQPPRAPATSWAPLPSAGGPPPPLPPQSPPPQSPPLGATQAPPPPVSPYGPPPVGEGAYMQAGTLPPASGAGAAMVLGIISLISGVFSCCCLGPVSIICGILAINFSGKAMREIDAGQADPADRGKANAGKICGIIGLVLGILGTIWIVINMARGGFESDFNF